MSDSPKNLLLHVTTVPMTLRFLRGQVSFMKKQGFDIQIASSPGVELDSFGEEEGVSVHGIAIERRISPLKDLVSLLKLWVTIRRIKPDIVHSHTPKGGLLGMCAARLAGVPVRCYHLRGLPMMGATGPKRELLRWTERLSCALADEVFCVSHSLRDVALKEQLCPEYKIQVLAGGSGNGVDSEKQYNPENWSNSRREIRRNLAIPDNAVVVGFVGRMVIDKGVVELYEAWQSLREQFSNAILLLVGPRESGDAVPEVILTGFDTDSRVRWIDMVPNAAPYYQSMDLIVLPTYREGFPNVLLEAASMKLPVVATKVPGCVDAVEDGITGTLVEVQNVPALANAIADYLKDKTLRDSQGMSARKRVVRNFSQNKIWKALLKEYATLLLNKHVFSRLPKKELGFEHK